MKKNIDKILIFYFIIIFATVSAFSQSDSLKHPKKNFIHYAGLFLGLNSVFEDGLYSFVIMTDYEFKYSQNLGIGAFFQFNIGKKPEFLFGIPLYYHGAFEPELNLFIAPGLCFTDNIEYINPNKSEYEDPDLNLPYPNPARRGNFFIRFGGNWNFPYKIEPDHNILVQPYLHIDWINQEKFYLVIGVKGCYVFE
jgi:hypothetical protein